MFYPWPVSLKDVSCLTPAVGLALSLSHFFLPPHLLFCRKPQVCSHPVVLAEQGGRPTVSSRAPSSVSAHSVSSSYRDTSPLG